MASIADLSSISDSYWDGIEDGDGGEAPDDKLTSATSIFGRTRETLLLRETFEKLRTTRCASTVVVHGESGVGKTSLVDTLRVPVVESRGYFCAGKFFQNSAFQEPFSAITAAFSDLCDLVTQSEDFNEGRRSRIQQALGTDGHLLTLTISNITPLLANDENTGEPAIDLVTNENVLSKFSVACKTFIQAMASNEHPLVVFIDDIQWMDIGSRQLIELFIADQDLKNVLFILAYRDEEAEKTTSIFREDFEVVNISLKSLEFASISDMVCSFVGETSQRMEDLAHLVAKRSHGNPFHANEFLAMIEDEGLMTFNPDTRSWAFDVDEVRTSTMMLCDLADVLTRKIGLVHFDIKETLKVASVMGYRFSESLLVEVMSQLRMRTYPAQTSPALQEHNSETLTKLLFQATEIGFIERIKNGAFQFTHDKIQTAFCEMIVDNEAEGRIHLMIGETIVARRYEADDYSTVYHAAIHLNASSMFATSENERRRLVEINLEAAKFCMRKSAFVAASELLQDGLTYLSPTEQCSETNLDLTLQMTEDLAKAELIIGNFDSAKEAVRKVLLHAKSSEVEMKALLLDVEVRLASNEIGELIHCVKRALLAVGVKMPRCVSKLHVLSKVFRLKMMMRNKTDEQILSLRKVDKGTISTAVKLLSSLVSASFLQGEKTIGVYSALKAMEITLNHGLSPCSSTAFVVYGVVQTTLGNQDEACRMGKLAQRLLNTTGCKSSVCFTDGYAATMVTWRKEPMTGLQDQLFHAAKVGFEVGDISGAAYCASQALVFGTVLGTSLREIENSIRYFWGRIAELRQDGMLLWFKPTFQYILNLQRHPANWRDALILTGDAMDEENYIRETQEAKNPTLHAVVLSYKCILACYFGYFKEATEFCIQAENVKNAVQISYGQMSKTFAVSFSHFEHYRVTGNRKYLRKGRQSRKKLEEISIQGSPDAETILAFVCAVEMSLKRSLGKKNVLDIYNNAISFVVESGNHRLEGLLNEHAGFDLVRRGHLPEARSYFKRAIEVYEHTWHSNAKFEWLTEKSAAYSEEPAETASPASQVGSFIVCSADSSQLPA